MRVAESACGAWGGAEYMLERHAVHGNPQLKPYTYAILDPLLHVKCSLQGLPVYLYQHSSCRAISTVHLPACGGRAVSPVMQIPPSLPMPCAGRCGAARAEARPAAI